MTQFEEKKIKMSDADIAREIERLRTVQLTKENKKLVRSERHRLNQELRKRLPGCDLRDPQWRERLGLTDRARCE